MNNMKSEFMSLSEASEFLGVHKNTLRRYVKTGVLKAYKAPGNSDNINKIYFKREDVETFFKPIDNTDDVKQVLYD